MSLIQFLRILAARWMIIAAAAGGCFVTATIISFLLPERYAATSRIMLDTSTPDEVTGQMIPTNARGGYASTQIALIKDYRTTGRVVDALGWANDPGFIAQYNAATGGRGYDIRRWYAEQIADGISTSIVQGSDILEITYTANSPEQARQIVDLIRQTFLADALQNRRESARDTANWFDEQTQKALVQLNLAEEARNKYAREHGIVLQGDVDSETAKLSAMTGQSANAQAGQSIIINPGVSQASLQLDALDASIAQAATALGPNHPQLQAMRRQRQVLAANVSRESATGGGSNSGAVQAAYEAQKRKVLGQGEHIDRLNQLQNDVLMRRDQYQKAGQRAADLRVQADASSAGLVPLGDSAASNVPVWPNRPVIILGSLALGLGLGMVLALLVELFARRVRSDEDLSHATGAPVFAIIGAARSERHWRSILLRLLDRRKGQRENIYSGA